MKTITTSLFEELFSRQNKLGGTIEEVHSYSDGVRQKVHSLRIKELKNERRAIMLVKDGLNIPPVALIKGDEIYCVVESPLNKIKYHGFLCGLINVTTKQIYSLKERDNIQKTLSWDDIE